MGVKAGDRLVGYVEAGKLIIRSRDDLIREMQELFRLKPGEESFSTLIRRERDEEVARERDRD